MRRETVILAQQCCWECVTRFVFREKITHEDFLPQRIKNLKLLLMAPAPFSPTSLFQFVLSSNISILLSFPLLGRLWFSIYLDIPTSCPSPGSLRHPKSPPATRCFPMASLIGTSTHPLPLPSMSEVTNWPAVLVQSGHH